MAKLVLLISSLFIFNVYASNLFVVSDLDDTIKITQVQSRSRMVWNGLFTKKVFTGVDNVFRAMEGYTDKTYVLTSSPSFLKYNITSLFKKYDLNVHHLITRNIIKDRDSRVYKFKSIERIIKNDPSARLILIGDNTDSDHLIYQDIQKKYPDSIEAIYMHKVKTGEIPKNQKVWFSSIDLAYYEFLANRLNESEVFEVFSKLEKSSMKHIIPNKLYCPTSLDEWSNVEIESIRKIALKIVSYCTGRRKEINDL